MSFGKNFQWMPLLFILPLQAAPAAESATAGQSNTAAPPSVSPSLRQIVDEIDCRRLPLRTFSAHMKVKLKRNGENHNLDASYVGDDRGNVRLRLTGPFGILALDLSQHNGRIECWMPLQKLAISGSRSEIMNDGTSELGLLAAVGNAMDMFFPRPWIDGTAVRRGKTDGAQVVIRAFDESQKICLAAYLIDPASKTISAQSIFNRAGEPMGSVSYGEYCNISSFSNAKQPLQHFDSTQLVPRQIFLSDVNGKFALNIEMESIAINTPIVDKQFILKLPTDLDFSDFRSLANTKYPVK